MSSSLRQFSKGGTEHAGPKRSRPSTGPADPDVLNAIHEAIGEQLQVAATYVDEEGKTGDHVFFPIELGAKNREPRVWAYQTAGGSEAGWRCYVVSRLSNVTTRHAAWTVPEDIAASARCLEGESPPAPEDGRPQLPASWRP